MSSAALIASIAPAVVDSNRDARRDACRRFVLSQAALVLVRSKDLARVQASVSGPGEESNLRTQIRSSGPSPDRPRHTETILVCRSRFCRVAVLISAHLGGVWWPRRGPHASARMYPAGRLKLKKTVPVAVVRSVARSRDDLLEEIGLIYRHRYPVFLRVAVAITGDEQLGADAVQDAFVGIVRSRRGIRRRGALEAFAWRAVVNAARDRRAVRAEVGEPPEPSAPSAAEPDEVVRRAIAELPERQRLVLFLRYFADLDYASIGRAMHVRPGTVAAALNAGRAAVKESLERQEATWRS